MAGFSLLSCISLVLVESHLVTSLHYPIMAMGLPSMPISRPQASDGSFGAF